MKLAIIGSRNFNDYAWLKRVLTFRFPVPELVVSGGAGGADSLAERWAEERGIKTLIYKADWDLHGKKAGILRNVDIINACDEVLAFWDGESRGTKDMIDRADKKGLKVFIYQTGGAPLYGTDLD